MEVVVVLHTDLHRATLTVSSDEATSQKKVKEEGVGVKEEKEEDVVTAAVPAAVPQRLAGRCERHRGAKQDEVGVGEEVEDGGRVRMLGFSL